MKLDLRARCARKRCGKIRPAPRENSRSMTQLNWARYAPFCSYACQEWSRLEDAQEYINDLKRRPEACK